MDETTRKVLEFHRAFGQRVRELPSLGSLEPATCRALLDVAGMIGAVAERCMFLAEQLGPVQGEPFLRLQLITEETGELAEALGRLDKPNALRELCDLTYVVDGSYVTMGMADVKLPAFREVHRANMSKLGADGAPIISPAGRVVKGPMFVPPDMERVLSDHARRAVAERGGA